MLRSMRLRQYREAAGLTQVQLSQLSGIDQGHISRIETGQVPRPSVETVRRLAQAVGVSLDDIAQPAELDTLEVSPEVSA